MQVAYGYNLHLFALNQFFTSKKRLIELRRMWVKVQFRINLFLCLRLFLQ